MSPARSGCAIRPIEFAQYIAVLATRVLSRLMKIRFSVLDSLGIRIPLRPPARRSNQKCEDKH